MLEFNVDAAIQEKAEELRILSEAKRIVREADYRYEPVIGSNARREPADADYRIGRIMVAGGYTLITARRKSGKSTLVGNLIKSLTSGEPFLGEFRTHGRSRVFLIDLEMSPDMHGRWLKSMGLLHEPKLWTAYLRGRARSLDPLDPAHFEELVAHLRELEIDVLIIDPLGPLFRAHGVDENSSDAGKIIDRLVELKDAAGISELIMVHHTGKDASKGARGSSVFEDTPDANWILTGHKKGTLAKLEAFGRDVDVTRSLKYDPDTRGYTACDIVAEESTENDNAIFRALLEFPDGISTVQLHSAAKAEGYTGNREALTDRLFEMKLDGRAVNNGSDSRPKWALSDNVEYEEN